MTFSRGVSVARECPLSGVRGGSGISRVACISGVLYLGRSCISGVPVSRECLYLGVSCISRECLYSGACISGLVPPLTPVSRSGLYLGKCCISELPPVSRSVFISGVSVLGVSVSREFSGARSVLSGEGLYSGVVCIS